MTQQAALDNEAARQQLALEQQQSQARIAEAQKAMEDALAQQQAAYVAQQQQAQQQQAAADTAAMSTGNKWADEFIASADKFNYGTHGIDPNGATLWNRKVLDNWLDAKAKEENWNALQKDQIKKQVKDAVVKASTNKNLFDVEERGFWGAVGDIGNSLADGAIGGLADLASTLNIAAYEGAKRMDKAGYTDALGNINPVYALEKAWEFTGLGDGKLNWDKQIDDAVVAARAAWGDLKSDYSKDAARARAEASGVAETLLALGDKPTTAFDELASALGVVVGAKGLNLVGKGVAAVGKGVVRGTAKAASKATFGLADDVLRASGTQLGRATGVLKPVAERLNPSLLARSAAIEGSGNAMDVLRQEGAYNADTAQYTDDALATAAATGLLTGGITYLGGRLFNTVEGTAARALGGRAAAGNTTLGQTLLSGSGITIEQALRTVADDIAAGAASKATRDVLGEATEYLMSRTAQLVPKSGRLSAVFNGTKQLTSGMLGEGLEEGLIGMISSAATQGLGKDGTFNTNNIDIKEVMRAGANAATLGATLGVVSGSVEAAGKYRENRANVDRILRDNEQADANLQEARQLWYDLENPAGVAQPQAQPQAQPTGDPLQQAQAQAQAQQPTAPLALPSPTPTLAIPSNIDPRLPDDVYREMALQAYKERVAQADAARADREMAAEVDATKQRAMGDRLADYAKTEQAKVALNEVLTPEQRAERATAGFRFADDVLNRSDIHVPQGVRATIELLGQLERAQDLIKSGTLDKATEQSLIDSASQLLRYATRQGRLEAARTWVDKNLLKIKTPTPTPAQPAPTDGTTKAVSNTRSTKTVLENNGISGAAAKDVMRLMKDVRSPRVRVEVNNYIEALTSDEPTDVGYYRGQADYALNLMYLKQWDDWSTADANAQQLLDDLEATLTDGIEARAATKEAASQEGAAAEAKKLQLTLFDEVTPDDTQAVHDTARAMQKHGAPTAVMDFPDGWQDDPRFLRMVDRYELKTGKPFPRNQLGEDYQQALAAGRTELNEQQWYQVRSPQFKAWFGDWETDPANASKVINPRTGEPLVVYHGTAGKFEAFDRGARAVSGSATNDGFFFSDSPDVAGSYASVDSNYAPQPMVRGRIYDIDDNLTHDLGLFDSNDALYEQLREREAAGEYVDWDGVVTNTEYPQVPLSARNIIPAFLNIRQPKVTDFGGLPWNALPAAQGGYITTDVLAREAQRSADGAVFTNVRDSHVQSDTQVSTVYVAYDANQIKSAVDNSGEFSASDARFRHQRGTHTEWDAMSDAEKHLAIEQQTIARGTNALRNTFGDEIARNVVWVSPRSQSLHNRNSRAYVLDGDPNTIYVVAHPHMTNQQFVYAVAHEMLHQGVDVNLRGKVLRGADYTQHMTKLAENPFVQALVSRIGERYGNIDTQSMVEEALAEIHAARTTKDGWNTLRNEWGLDMEIPAALRSTNSSSLVSRIVSYLKQVVSRLTGKYRKASDSAVADFLKVVTARRPNDTAGIRTPDQVNAYRQRMSFEAAQARSDYYHNQARGIYPDFDSLDATAKAQVLSQLATGDDQAQTELGLQIRNSLLPVNDPWKDPKWRAQQQAADHAKKVAAAQQAANQVPPSGNQQAQADYVRRTVRQIRIYPSRANTSYYNAADLDAYVGIISQVRKGDAYFIRVEMNDDATGAKGIIYEEPTTTDIDLDMHKAWEALVQQYPNAHYERREGSTYSTEANRALTPEELVVLNRAQQMGLSSPSLRRWTNWLRNKLPANYVPILDKFLDVVEMARTHWVSIYTPFIAVEQMYAAATGKQTNIITRLLRDKSEAGAFLHRNFNSTNPKQQSLRDRTERLRQTIIDSGISQEKVNRILHGLEERVRSDVLLNSDESLGHWQEVNGNRVLFDPATGRPRYTVTGYRFQDLDTTDPNAGAYDLRGIRLAQALANLTVEERNKIGSIVAEVAETNRIVNKLKHERGVLTDKDYYERVNRGKDYLNLVFPELAAQGVDFGGFFVTMRDDDSSAYSKAHALGRASAVENVLGNTAKVWEAEVKTAFTNNELSQFALMVMSMPNKHFVIDPVSPRNNFDDPDNVLDWETSHKGEQDSILIYINGTPVRLVARSKAAAKALRQEQPHAAVAKIGSINHYFNQFKTSLNPAYPVFGLMRDIMTGYLNISGAIGEQYVDSKSAPAVGMRSIGYALKYLFSPDKHNLFLGTARGQYTDPWQLAYQRLGAGMQFGDNLNTDAFATNALTGRLPHQADLLRTGVSKVRGITSRVAETIAYPPETAMRLGVFRAYVEHVFGPQPSNVTAEQLVDLFDQAKNPVNADKAAAIILGTKNLTSNFQQHGADNMVRHVFSFHNAVMQGTFSTLPQILSTKHGRNSMALLGIGLLMAAVANVGGEDDDEFGNSKYYQIANRNRTVKLGDVQIPIPDEMGWFKLLTDNAVGVAMGKRNIIDAATEQAGGMVDMTTAQHWGNTDNAVANAMFFAAPAFAQPAVALTTGKDIFGRDLKSEYAYDENGKRIQFAADVERTTHRASSTGTDIAEMLYGATGGAVDMTGDEIDVLGQGYLGGLYRSVTRGIDASADRDMGIGEIVGSELFRSTKPIHIDGASEEAWKNMGEKLHVSTRHAGGTLDILNADIDPSVTEAQRIYAAADKKMRAAKSDMGYSYKQLNDMIRQAEAEGRYQDVRDYRADMRTIRTNKAAIREEATTELNLLGIK
jgi:hypothetical protein